MKNGHETLGKNVKPSHYDLKLDINTKSFTYRGDESIIISISKPTRSILLNALNITISSAAIVHGTAVQKARVRSKGDQIIELAFSKAVNGAAELRISFAGKIEERLEGIYKSPYKHKGKVYHLISTQFEPTDARRMFPCFDEPELKATFTLSLVVDSELECISNMPIKLQKGTEKGKKQVTFDTTPRMSTYLLYVGVGKYSHLGGKYRNIKLRVLATPGKEKLLELPMEYLKRFLAHHEHYFGIHYPLPKLDLIAVPDFPVGAMENWGAIAFRESALLGDMDSPIASKQRIAEVIGHELAHQWFGDLVTMKWWNDLWLNESFATFIEEKASNALFPEWKIREQKLDDTKAVALNTDQSQFTHPVSVPVTTPDQIASLFDRISYDKGSSLLLMMEDYAGIEAFRKGLHAYLKKHSYSNAEKDDLWRAIDAASRKKGKASILNVADYWTDAPGYPIIFVEAKGTEVALSQKRFFLLGESKSNGIWPIPVHYSVGNEKIESMLLSARSARLKVPEGMWVDVNYRQAGYYRVGYDKSILEKLGVAIKSGALGNANAWGIENDISALARTSRVSAAVYSDFVEKYMMDSTYPANVGLTESLSWMVCILGQLRGQRQATLLKRFARRLLERIGWEKKDGEGPVETYVRNAAIRALGMHGDDDAIKKANEMFDGFVSGARTIDPDLLSTILLIVAKHGDAKTYDAVTRLYLKEENPQLKVRYMQAVAAFGDRALIRRVLAFSLSKDVRAQDLVIMTRVSSTVNPESIDLLWEWTKEHWQSFMQKFAPSNSVLDDLVKNMRMAATEELKKDVEKFFGDRRNMRQDIEREVKQTLEVIEANIRFINSNAPR